MPRWRRWTAPGSIGVLAARRVVCALTDGVQIRVARRARILAQEGRSESPDEVLREKGRRSGREAATAARREQACARLPVFEPALADGSVTTGHLDALAAATAGLSDAQRAEVAEHEAVLLADATRSSVDVFERHCRDLVHRLAIDDGADRLAALRRRNRVRRWVDHVTGMHHLHAELDPESAAKVWTAINHQLATLRHQQHTTTTGASNDTADRNSDRGNGAAMAAPTAATVRTAAVPGVRRRVPRRLARPPHRLVPARVTAGRRRRLSS